MGLADLPLNFGAARWLGVTLVMAMSGCGGEARTQVTVGAHRLAVPAAHFREATDGALLFALDPAAAQGSAVIVSVEDAGRFCARHPASTDAVRAVCVEGAPILPDSFTADALEKVPAGGSESQWSYWLKPAGGRPRAFVASCSHFPGEAGICTPVKRIGDLIVTFDLPADAITRLPARIAQMAALLAEWEAAAQR